MSGAAVSWKSQKQTCVALSTAEAEYITLAAATQEATWMRQLLEDLHRGQIEPTVICEDNQSSICIAQNPQYHNRTKHIDIKYHYVRKKVLDTTIELQYCPMRDMIANILTKGLTYDSYVVRTKRTVRLQVTSVRKRCTLVRLLTVMSLLCLYRIHYDVICMYI